MTSKAIHEDGQCMQKCYQNQYVEDPRNKFIKVQTLTPLKFDSKVLFNNEKELATENVTSHMYETINECCGYENGQPQSVIFTHPVERGKVKNNNKFVDNSGYLFYNVTTIDPSIHKSEKLFNCEMKGSKHFPRHFHRYRRPKTHHNEYENYRSFRVVENHQ